MADRSSEMVFLGSKSNAFGSGLFFNMNTLKVVSRDQYVSIPWDSGSISRMNAIARKGPLVPRKVPVYFRGVELPDDLDFESDMRAVGGPSKVITASDTALPDFATSFGRERSIPSIVIADEVVTQPDPYAQALPTAELVSRPVENGGVNNDVENRGEPDMYSPSVVPSPAEPAIDRSPRKAAVDVPWFEAGAPIVDGEKRIRKKPVRYGVDVLYAGDNKSRSVAYSVLPGVNGRRPVSKYHPHVEPSEWAYNISVEKAIKSIGKPAVDSMMKELSSIHEKGVLQQVTVSSLSFEICVRG
jgi:hypothetical protein